MLGEQDPHDLISLWLGDVLGVHESYRRRISDLLSRSTIYVAYVLGRSYKPARDTIVVPW